MRQPDRNSSLYQLSVSRAPELRCVNSPVKSCGECESCRLGAKLTHTKEWFDRCGETVKRQYILGLVERFDSIDLLEYVISLLQSFQYKDFTYMRSRSKPSLTLDNSCPPSNHALNEQDLEISVDNYLKWFCGSTYWTKANYLLGLMQMCDTHLLHIMATKTRISCERERRKHRAQEDGLIDREHDEYMSLCSFMSGSDDALALQTEMDSYTSQPSRSAENLSESSGIHGTPDIYSMLCAGTDEKRLWKSSAEFSAPKSGSHRDPNSVDVKSEISAGYVGSPVSPCRTRSIPPSRQSFRKSPNEMTDFEREFFSEDYMSGGGDDDGNFFDSAVQSVSLSCIESSPEVDLGSGKFKDFIRCLPVHLSKCILGLLDKNSLTNCLCLSKHWRVLAEEVKQDYMVHQIMTEEIMLMQGASAKGMNPRYAKFISVHVPLELDKNAKDVLNLTGKTCKEVRSNNLKECYEGIPTKEVQLEERNVYCGAYNVLVLQDMEDPNRCANFTGGRLVVSGSYDRRVRLIDSSTGRCERTIQGHAGSIRCVYISEDRGIALSGGYDTSIRCWDTRGNCTCIFRGHRATVLCIALHGNHLASGSRDKNVKVWNFSTGKCRRTFRHRHVVLTVHVSNILVVSGCEGGKVKVWDIEQASLLKSLDGHHGAITCVKFDDYHIITGSVDGYAMAWSSVGRHKKCLQAFRHPKEVLCVEFLYCRVITGSADGKLRIWNLLNGDCLRIIRGNSKNDAITTIRASGDRMIVNTLSNLLIFNFEAVEWNYHLPAERPEGLGPLNIFSKTPPRRLTRAHVRAHKLLRADTKDSLPSRAPSRMKYLDQGGVTLAPHNLPLRISSAPPRIKHQESTLNSINTHIKRILSAHQGQTVFSPSSTAVTPACKTSHWNKYNVTPVDVDGDLRSSMIITQVNQHSSKSQSFPNKGRSHVIARSRSAPAYRTQTLPTGKRGWTTSAPAPLKAPANKIMVTAEQAREKTAKLRPQSAQVLSRKESASLNPVKSLSCLNLKTYSGQVQFEHDLRRGNFRGKSDGRVKSVKSDSTYRPKSCVPCVR